MKIFRQWLEQQGRQITTQPLSRPVNGMQDAYIATEGLKKLGWRILRRKLYLLINRQFKSYRQEMDGQWRKGLWIYFRTAQIGDSLMDLSARSYFSQKNCSIDLWTSDLLANLYSGDDWFDRVTSNFHDIAKNKYDFVVVQSMHHSALKFKIKHYKNVPWICMQGFYDVPDFDRATWGAQRLFDFYQELNNNSIDWHGRQKLSSKHLLQEEKKHRVTVVLGGMDPVRTYDKWDQIVDTLQRDKGFNVTLVGSGEKAQNQADEIMTLQLTPPPINLVNQIDLSGLIRVISETRLLLVADGGAMHIGVALNVPKMVTLFIKGIPPFLRIPHEYRPLAITSSTGLIKDISTEEILSHLNVALSESNFARPDLLHMRHQ